MATTPGNLLVMPLERDERGAFAPRSIVIVSTVSHSWSSPADPSLGLSGTVISPSMICCLNSSSCVWMSDDRSWSLSLNSFTA